MTAKKAIILSYEHSAIELVDLMQPLIISCQEYNLELVSIIKAASPYDSKAIQHLIKEIISQRDSTVVITDLNTYASNTHIPTWCVLGTLLTAELIDRVMVYWLEKPQQKDNSNKVRIFEAPEAIKYDLLDLSFLRFRIFAEGQAK